MSSIRQTQLIWVGTILVVAFSMVYAILHRNQAQHSISVTGLGAKDFESDLIVWSGTFSRKSMDLKQAYALLDKDRAVVKEYFEKKGVTGKQVVYSSVSIMKDFASNYNPSTQQTESYFTGYLLSQTVAVESREVDKVEELSRQVSEMINYGVEFTSNPPEYYYTKLAELKVQMVAEATKDAKKRAETIAEEAGARLGDLKKAQMGVFQIVAQNSSEDFSWGGAFNTSAKRKTANITMKVDYGVK